MERWIKIPGITLIFMLAGCNDPAIPTDPYEFLSDEEISLIGTWTYDSVQVGSTSFIWATDEMEPGKIKAELGGARAELSRRMIAYYPEKTYQLLWIDRGNYSLGAVGLPNWQPDFGFWQLNETGDTLIHNYGTDYETRYMFEISNESLTRESRRYMNSNYNRSSTNNGWYVGRYVNFTEYFVKNEG